MQIAALRKDGEASLRSGCRSRRRRLHLGHRPLPLQSLKPPHMRSPDGGWGP